MNNGNVVSEKKKIFLKEMVGCQICGCELHVERMKEDIDNNLLTITDIDEIEGHLFETFKINMRCLKEVKRHAQGGVSE